MYLTEKQSYGWLLLISSWLSIVTTWSIMVEAASVTSLTDGVLYDLRDFPQVDDAQHEALSAKLPSSLVHARDSAQKTK